MNRQSDNTNAQVFDKILCILFKWAVIYFLIDTLNDQHHLQK